mmetsp:Transcript_35753/g.80590  ORF Transcript_35753/g.80590 Transcript_35753/m.80590 type:complete len:220 (-) Transcript_35753:137-796(-)
MPQAADEIPRVRVLDLPHRVCGDVILLQLRVEPRDELEHNHSVRVHVALVRDAPLRFLQGGGAADLRCGVEEGPSYRLVEARCHAHGREDFADSLLLLPRHVEVSDAGHGLGTWRGEEDVGWFDVAVHDVVLPQVLQPLQHLQEHPMLLLIAGLCSLTPVEQSPALVVGHLKVSPQLWQTLMPVLVLDEDAQQPHEERMLESPQQSGFLEEVRELAPAI